VDLNLPAEGGTLRLLDPTATELDAVVYGPQLTAVSEGRLPDGAANIQAFPGTASPAAPNYAATYNGPFLNELLARNDRANVSPWGSYCDWVEIRNAGSAAVSLAGMALGDSADPAERWVFPIGTSIDAGDYLLVWCDSSRAASTGLGSPLNSGFSLAGTSGSVVLFNANGQPVDSVAYGFQIADKSIGRIGNQWSLLATPSPGSANGTAAALGSTAGLRLNEWLASSVSADDWIELHNTDALPVDLSGLYLTDDPSVNGVTKFRIGPLSFIEGRGWVVWEADGDTAKGANHTTFSLNDAGETLRLYDAGRAVIDVQDFGIQTAGVSVGRLPDGAAGVVDFEKTASPNESNYLLLTNVVINEILAHTDLPLEDAVELYNLSTQAVDIGGWYLSDSQSDLKRYRIPDNTLIQGQGYAVFYQAQFGTVEGEQDSPPKFSLNAAHGDAVYLSQADGGAQLTGYRANAKFGASANAVSVGRHVTSVGVDFVPLSQRTFGVDNLEPVEQFRTGTGLTNALPLVGPVVISEIMYHPSGEDTNSNLEYVELHNTGSLERPLFDPSHVTNRWRLAGAIDFEFTSATSIPSGGCLVVVPFDPIANPAAKAAFEARYGTGFALTGPFSGRLANSGESIELLRPDAPQAAPRADAGFVPYILMERISFTDTNPWPSTADGLGDSLHRVSQSAYANDPVNWMAAAPSPGTVNGVILDSDGDGLPDWWEEAFGTLKGTPDAEADPDEDGLTNRQEYLAGTHPMNSESSLKLSIAASEGAAWLHFSAAANRSYSVLFKESLESLQWQKLHDLEARATNWQSDILVSPESTNRYYRIVTPKL
jgi:hypothetical protein